MEAPIIQIKNVHKHFGKVHALRGVDLNVNRGEVVVIIGPSGSGKSTLMNLLGCRDSPTSGSYRLDGEEVSQMSSDQRAHIRNRRIGFVFQNYNLLARTSALENVELPLLYTNTVTAKQRRQRATEMLERVGLADRMNHHPSQLSGGQQQRVAIARSLVNEPSVLMGDEPTGNLDSKTGREVINLFQSLSDDNGITIILVTHEQEVACQARRTLIVKDGRFVCDTTDFDQALQSLHSPE